MSEKPIAAARRELDAVKKAQAEISIILDGLERETGRRIESISVETRTLEFITAEIWLTKEQRR